MVTVVVAVLKEGGRRWLHLLFEMTDTIFSARARRSCQFHFIFAVDLLGIWWAEVVTDWCDGLQDHSRHRNQAVSNGMCVIAVAGYRQHTVKELKRKREEREIGGRRKVPPKKKKSTPCAANRCGGYLL
jgi:hypothetical protein